MSRNYFVYGASGSGKTALVYLYGKKDTLRISTLLSLREALADIGEREVPSSIFLWDFFEHYTQKIMKWYPIINDIFPNHINFFCSVRPLNRYEDTVRYFINDLNPTFINLGDEQIDYWDVLKPKLMNIIKSL